MLLCINAKNVNVMIRNGYKGYFANMDTEKESESTSISCHT